MINQTRYPRDMSFIDRQGRLVRPNITRPILPSDIEGIKKDYLTCRNGILIRLRKKLKGLNSWQRKKILEGVYKQLVVSTTGKTAKGEYRNFVEKKDDVTQYLVRYVSRELENNGLENHSDILKKQYGIKGQAYAFFDCDASESCLKKVMQKIVENPESPKGLELAVQKGVSEIELDEKLARAIQYPDDYRIMTHNRLMKEPEIEEKPASSLKYSLITKYPGLSNEDTAKRTGDIMMNYVRNLNNDPDLFRCALVYEKKGEYHLLG